MFTENQAVLIAIVLLVIAWCIIFTYYIIKNKPHYTLKRKQ